MFVRKFYINTRVIMVKLGRKCERTSISYGLYPKRMRRSLSAVNMYREKGKAIFDYK